MADLTDQQKDEIGTLATAMFEKDPKTFKKAAKEVFPDLSIPEIEQEQALLKSEEKSKEEIQKLREELDLERRTRAIADKRKELQGKGYSEEDVAEIEKLITGKEVNTYGGAEELYRARRDIAEPNTGGYPNQRIESGFTPEKLKEMQENPNYHRDEAHAAINDIRSGKAKLNEAAAGRIPRLI